MVVLADPWMRGDWLNGFRHVEIAKVNGICGGRSPRGLLSFCHTKPLHSKNPSFLRRLEMRTTMILIPSIAFALPALAQPKCDPRGQCAKNWWKSDKCACYIPGGKAMH